MEQQIQEFLQQLPKELQQKIAKLPPEQQIQVVEQLMAKAQGSTQQYKYGGGVWNNFEPIIHNRADDYPNAERIDRSTFKNPKENEIYIDDERPFQYKEGKYIEYYTPEEIKLALEFRGKQEANKTSIPSEISNPITNMLYNTDSPYREYIRRQKWKNQPQDEYKYGGSIYAKDGAYVPTTDMNLDDASTMDGDYYSFNNNKRQASDTVPIEAEKNENITSQDGQEPLLDNGYLKELSHNPISGQSTYELPNDKENPSHENGGVDLVLKEGDIVNSDKTKIPFDFKIYGKNFKSKTFKDASDFISKKEKSIQEDFEKDTLNGKADKVTEGSVSLMLAKMAKYRDELNNVQEQVLESKKQKDLSLQVSDHKAEMGKLIKGVDKSKIEFYKKPTLKAANGLEASIQKVKSFSDKLEQNRNASSNEVLDYLSQSGMLNSYQPLNGSKSVGAFKDTLAQKETGSYKNPYIAVAGVDEELASTKSFDELKSQRASTGIGKYQFLWGIHKGNIKKVTGITKPDDFRHNPEAQESFMDWFRDNELLPEATQLKQKYQLPQTIEQLMAMVHLEGKSGLEKKIKSGTLSSPTYAGKFQNATPEQYAKGFKYGGKASTGLNVWKGDKSGINKPNYTNEDLQAIAKDYFPNQTFNSNKELQEAIISYLDDNFGGYEQYVQPISPYANKKTPLPGALYDDMFGDDWNGAINLLKNNKPVSVPAPGFNIDAYANKDVITLPDGQIVNLGLANDNSDLTRLDRNPAIQRTDSSETQNNNNNNIEGGNIQGKKSDWLKKIGTGFGDALPYLDNLRLLMEGKIDPILQQKNYHNPYDNLNTDVDIQSSLNDIDRSTLTGISSSTGNPSVRNARIAQLIANAQPAKASLYSQKYNQERQLGNQKTLGQGEYLNNWEDINMNLKKTYEREVLQTIENQRQQRHMAIDKMMNDYLRKGENRQNTELALAETNYDWNPYTKKVEFNPDKAAQNTAYRKFVSTNQPQQTENSKIKNIGGHQYVVKKNGNLECIDCEDSKKGKYGMKVY